MRRHGVLITGASGEIGHGLITRLAQEGSTTILTLDVRSLEPALGRMVHREVVGGMIHSIMNATADFSPLDRWIPVLEEIGRTLNEFPSEEIELRFASAMFSALVTGQPWHPEIEIWENHALFLAERSSNLTLKFQTIFAEVTYRVNIGDLPTSLLAMNSLKKMAQSRRSSPLHQILAGFSEVIHNNHSGLHEKCLKAVSAALELSRTTAIYLGDSVVLLCGVPSALVVGDYQRF